jgi:N-acetylglucosamine-6-phosphate deacetylase
MSEIPGTYTGPGLVDLQMNGYAGFDFNVAAGSWKVDDFHSVRRALHRRGVVAALPTFITDDISAMIARAERYAAFVEDDSRLEKIFPLLHIEGPFISPDDGPRGAHPEAYCRLPGDAPDFIRNLQEASGDRIGIFTVAPELEGALEVIEEATAAGICVSIAHTQATRERIEEAVEAGAKFSTHLGNGSHQMLPRLDNYVQAQLSEDRLLASFIADGHHVPLYTLKNFIRAKTPERSVLVTDAIVAAEVGPGRYSLGNEEVVVTDDLYVSKPGEPNLAGSALTLDRAVVNVAGYCDVRFEQAWTMASTRPAALVNLPRPPEVTVDIVDGEFRNVRRS